MLEFTPAQTAVLERLVARGFTLVAFPLYASAVGVRRGPCAALLAPVQGGGWRLLGEAHYLIDGNLSVRVTRGGRTMFVWKSREVAATPALLADLARFSADLSELLPPIV